MNNINTKNSNFSLSKGGKDGVREANKSTGAKDPKVMKATAHMDMTKDGGVMGKDAWKGGVKS